MKMQRSFVAAAALVAVGGCGQPTGLDDSPAPGAVYARSCSEAPSGWMRPGDNPGNYPLWHHLAISRVQIATDNSLRWNGTPVTRPALRAYLTGISTLEPPMAVVLRVDRRADCQMVRNIRHDMEELVRCRSSGLCGEGDGDWD